MVQQLEGLTKTQGLSLTASRSDDEVESSVLVYNLAVARFQQRHMLQASQLAGRLLPTFLPIPSFCQEDFDPPLRAKPGFAPARTNSHTHLAIYYFKNALDRLEGGETSEVGQSTSWLTHSQVFYNIGISLLHARRQGWLLIFCLRLWGLTTCVCVCFHLAECCMLAHQPDNLPQGREREMSQGGAGLSYKLVASAPASLQWGPPTHQGQLQCSPWTLPMFA